MKFHFLDSCDYVHWDAFVAESPQGSIFSTSGFLNALRVQYRIAVLSNSEGIVAGIVLAKNLLGAYANPLFAKYLGIILPPERENTKYVYNLAREHKLINALIENLSLYRSFDYTFHPNFSNWLPFYWSGYRQETRYTYYFPDISDIKVLLDNAHSRVRRNLRKAERHNVRFCSKIDPSSFYTINRLTFERQGGKPPFNFKTLKCLYRELKQKEQIHLLGVRNKADKLLAVAGIVNDKKCSYLLFNGMDHRLSDVGANTKLIIETLAYCNTLAPMFDFEGSMIRGIESFYQSFGAIQTPYFSVYRPTLRVIAKKYGIKIYKKFKYGR